MVSQHGEHAHQFAEGIHTLRAISDVTNRTDITVFMAEFGIASAFDVLPTRKVPMGGVMDDYKGTTFLQNKKRYLWPRSHVIQVRGKDSLSEHDDVMAEWEAFWKRRIWCSHADNGGDVCEPSLMTQF